jgi:putative tryptophan/tyrosine transport system substrate-binding protein
MTQASALSMVASKSLVRRRLRPNQAKVRSTNACAAGSTAVQAARGATQVIPIIAIDLESDPLASGFVETLARPGGNVTGIFLDFPDISSKCLEILSESVPALASVAVLWDPTTGSLQLDAVAAAAKCLGVGTQVFEARRVADIG